MYHTKGRMKVIKIADATEGTVLARDVRNSTGQVLIHSGAVLTPEILSTLIERGISQLTVQEEGDGETAGITEADFERDEEICREVVRERFSDPDADPMTQLLFRAALEHSARRMATDKS